MRPLFTFTPPSLSAGPEFLERGKFNFSRSVPLKDLCQHIFHQITLISHEDYKRSQRLYYMSFIINSGPRK